MVATPTCSFPYTFSLFGCVDLDVFGIMVGPFIFVLLEFVVKVMFGFLRPSILVPLLNVVSSSYCPDLRHDLYQKFWSEVARHCPTDSLFMGGFCDRMCKSCHPLAMDAPVREALFFRGNSWDVEWSHLDSKRSASLPIQLCTLLVCNLLVYSWEKRLCTHMLGRATPWDVKEAQCLEHVLRW